MEVINVRKHPEYLERAIQYFQAKWASENSKLVYQDCITRSLSVESLPIWYLLVDNDIIAGCVGLATNDFISCQDLWPWICALYIEENYRGNGLGNVLLAQAKSDAREMGFKKVYLSTDHVGYYEKYDFTYITTGYHPWGESSRVYECEVS